MEMRSSNNTYQDHVAAGSNHPLPAAVLGQQQSSSSSFFASEYENARTKRLRLIQALLFGFGLLFLFMVSGGHAKPPKETTPPPSSAATTSDNEYSYSTSSDDDTTPSTTSSTTSKETTAPVVVKEPKGYCETTVLLIRHCEKVGPTVEDAKGGQHCSLLGRERAHYLATLFGGKAARWPTPSRLYALTDDRDDHHNYREWETLYPLSQMIGVKTVFETREEMAPDYLKLLATNSLCGELTVVNWKHSWMHELAADLGCDEEAGCPDEYDEHDFDTVWMLKYVYKPEGGWLAEEEEKLGGGVRRRRLYTSFLPKGWVLYATVAHQDFDPLSFSYHQEDGAYP
jgi:hypothetical protein